eukprot:comp24887_c0_seq1/m.46907 comp24887_c0_seq1/g.46907  ORF comp24887_c0_seq1/g.46907 comp24887_c0_seq1/m.46907 type:complete len:178 (-) comp24887_c0_seq1:315-848(-)
MALSSVAPTLLTASLRTALPAIALRLYATQAPKLKVVSVVGEASGQKTTTVNGEGLKVTFDEPKRIGGSGLGQTPLEGLLSALAGCETATFMSMVQRQKLEVSKIEYKLDAEWDPRGFIGVDGVYPGFQKTTVDVKVHTTMDDAKLQELAKEVSKRCPVARMFEKSGCELKQTWTKA